MNSSGIAIDYKLHFKPLAQIEPVHPKFYNVITFTSLTCSAATNSFQEVTEVFTNWTYYIGLLVTSTFTVHCTCLMVSSLFFFHEVVSSELRKCMHGDIK